MTREETIRWSILARICDDYEEYELLTEELNRDGAPTGIHVEPYEIIQALRDLVEHKLAAAYWLGNTVQRIEGVPSEEESEQCYFMATKLGVRELEDMDLARLFEI